MFQLILSGLALGCIYSLVALGYHITFMTSRTLNFAQGSAMMLGAVTCLILVVDFGWSTPLAMVAAILVLGLALRATALDRDASLAVGIDVNLMVGLSYALSSMLAAIGGVLIGPLIGVSSSMGFLIGLKAFAVAIVGGLEHPVGILVASLAYGVMENLVGGYFGSSAKEIF